MEGTFWSIYLVWISSSIGLAILIVNIQIQRLKKQINMQKNQLQTDQLSLDQIQSSYQGLMYDTLNDLISISSQRDISNKNQG